MNSKNLPLVLGLAGLLAAWYFSRKQSAALATIIANTSSASVLPSRQIGTGYIDAIGTLPSRQIGNGYIGAVGHTAVIAPVVVDSSGDALPHLGTDLLLAGVDSSDPSLFDLNGIGQAPQYDIDAILNGDE